MTSAQCDPKASPPANPAEQPAQGVVATAGAFADAAADATAGATAEGLRIRLFAALRERAGWSERVMAMPCPGPTANGPTGPTPMAIWEALELGPWPEGLRVAVNQEFAEPHQRLAAGDELAFLPPISGG